MKRLMHCPFCGEDENLKVEIVDDLGAAYNFAATCGRCGALGPEATSSDKQTALDAAADDWNRRITPEEDTVARVAFALGN